MGTPNEDDFDLSQLVDLAGIAGYVKKSKRTLQRCVRDMPRPWRPGGPGQAALWFWSEVRPWLIEHFRLSRLPERVRSRDQFHLLERD